MYPVINHLLSHEMSRGNLVIQGGRGNNLRSHKFTRTEVLEALYGFEYADPDFGACWLDSLHYEPEGDYVEIRRPGQEPVHLTLDEFFDSFTQSQLNQIVNFHSPAKKIVLPEIKKAV